MSQMVPARALHPDYVGRNYRGQRGANFVEYLILITLIAFVAIVVVRIMGDRVSTRFSSAAEEFD